jgi:HD-GYP domain-containing protein (c-di-GMP phosphodiesterase class II)
MFRRRRLAKSLREYDLQPAADFLFERRPYEVRCADRKPGRREIDEGQTRAVLVAGNQAPYLLTRLDELRLSRADVPVLTVTADPSNCVAVAGSSRPDWSLRFCAQGEGETEDDARKRLQQISMARAGGTVLLTGPHLLSAEARDAYTKNHCERLARYATALGKELGRRGHRLPQEALRSNRLATGPPTRG